MNDYFYVDFVDAIHFLKLKEKLSGKIVGKWDGMEDVVSALSYNVKKATSAKTKLNKALKKKT